MNLFFARPSARSLRTRKIRSGDVANIKSINPHSLATLTSVKEYSSGVGCCTCYIMLAKLHLLCHIAGSEATSSNVVIKEYHLHRACYVTAIKDSSVDKVRLGRHDVEVLGSL